MLLADQERTRWNRAQIEEGLADLERRGDLGGYCLLWATEADLLRRLGRFAEVARFYRRALEQVGTGPEKRYLERRLAEVERG